MASIDEFLVLLIQDVDKAFKSYFFNIDAASLDGDTQQAQVCRRQKVRFDFVEPNRIVMSALDGADADYQNEIWYLPWRIDGASKANLGAEGPPFFSTSQLDGCRFTIQYHDASRKTATVFHLAGTLGHQEAGSKARNALETDAGLPSDAPAKLVRRYSISQGTKSKFESLGKDFTLQYDGDKAAIFGFRDDSGAWRFYAQQMMAATDKFPDSPPFGRSAKGIRELGAF